MKHIKKILAVVLTLAMVGAVIPAISEGADIGAAETFAITSPTENKLVAAGYFDIEWNAAEGTVKNYKLYIDNKLIGTTTDTTYEYYTTEVKMYTVYVMAEYTNGSTETTDTVNFGVSKKGLALATDMGANISLSDMGCSWYYNWGTSPSSGSQYKGIEYVPMVWKSTSASDFKSKVEGFKSSGYKYVLTFNEPDLSSQCNMTVDAVYSVWQGIDDVTGINVSSPVTALWPQASSDWFQPFMEKIDTDNDHDVDFIAIHCYPDNYGGSGMAAWFLESVVDWTWETYQKPIWITEFSTTGSAITATGSNGTKEFWEAVMPGLDEREYVERYAAFDFDSDTTGLWRYSTGELTAAGEVYRDLGNPEGYVASETSESDYKFSTSTRTTKYSDTITINGVTCYNYVLEDGVSAEASSVYGTNVASYAIDSSVSTRWESTQGVDPQTLTIDLGTVRNIKQINILWEATSAADYYIEVSEDGVNWTTVMEEEGLSSTQNRSDTILFSSMISARYIRITGTARSTTYGYSIWELAVYGTENTSVDETTAKETTTTSKQTTTTTAAATTTASGSSDNSGSSGGSVTTTASGSGSTASVTAPKKATIKSLKNKKKRKLKVKIKKIKGVTGYQVRVCDNKKFQGYVSKNSKKRKVTFKKLTKKTKYYVRARAYIIVNGKKVYGKWSKKKKIKIKK